MTYLELCRALVSELGIGSSNNASDVPSTTDGQRGQIGLACRWIAQTNLDIDNLFRDWTYLSRDYAETLVSGTDTAPAPSDGTLIRQWDRESLYLDKDTDYQVRLRYAPWETFRHKPTTGGFFAQPKWFSISPAGVMRFDSPADVDYALTGEYYKRPVLISGDNAVPDLPENYHRMIVAGAAVKYGNKESAPELIDGLGAEYEAMLMQLQSECLRSFSLDGMAGDDVGTRIEIP